MPMPRRIIQRGLVVDEIRVRLAEMGYPLFGSWNPKTRPSSGGGGVAVLLLVAFVVALACGLGDYLDRSESARALAFVVPALVVYFLPSLVAAGREHRNKAAIFVLNLLAGWTFIGWLIALVWAFTANTEFGRHVDAAAP